MTLASELSWLWIPRALLAPGALHVAPGADLAVAMAMAMERLLVQVPRRTRDGRGRAW
eukprot:CAMPEP_0206534362 /NCGR_PEP_ID=MMETSP0325_2-20121206/5504_1 /ASSEMBLY_ACC=CAM_ASM_000347 /TAXON_ID=2866 /ORGANISM="Crypthecodinium cohnii, Strain Seligo" /LENGTH=57 /DNA_ID=CAMNT_0054031159 /DNA_START=342 /DNA_END=512 /DNA_ORIENTATION=+